MVMDDARAGGDALGGLLHQFVDRLSRYSSAQRADGCFDDGRAGRMVHRLCLQIAHASRRRHDGQALRP